MPRVRLQRVRKAEIEDIQRHGQLHDTGRVWNATAEHIGVSSTLALLTKKVKEKEFAGYTDCGCNAGFHPGTVLDPFGGTGTTAIVARRQNKNFIGFDISKDYYKIARKRLADSVIDGQSESAVADSGAPAEATLPTSESPAESAEPSSASPYILGVLLLLISLGGGLLDCGWLCVDWWTGPCLFGLPIVSVWL